MLPLKSFVSLWADLKLFGMKLFQGVGGDNSLSERSVSVFFDSESNKTLKIWITSYNIQ